MKRFFYLAAAALVLTACSSDEEYIADDPIEAQITATIGDSPVTRVSDTSWGANDSIGVTMAGRYVNIKHVTAGTGGEFEGNPIYFKNKIEPVTMTAYYPFTGKEGTAPGVVSATTSSARQIPAEQTKFDFLFAREENVKGIEPVVKFSFSHKMSKLSLRFNNGNGANGVRIVSYSLDGLTLSGTFNPVTGDCAATTGTGTITVNPTGETNGVLLSPLILFPQSTLGKTVLLTVTDNENQTYACNLNFEDDALLSGNYYQYGITVHKTGLTVETVKISEWTTKESSFDAESVNP